MTDESEAVLAVDKEYQRLVRASQKAADAVAAYLMSGTMTRARTTTLNARWADAAARRDEYRATVLRGEKAQ